eukprot:scaffold6.g2571.t1
MVASPAPLTLPVGETQNSVRVHPVVLFTICDAFIRRAEGQERVIGTLLGTVGDGVVEIKNCYAVPHSESNDQARAAGGRRPPARPAPCSLLRSTSMAAWHRHAQRSMGRTSPLSDAACRRPSLRRRRRPPQQVAVDVQHHQTMASLQHKVAPEERIVGWFSTGPDISGSDALIHSFYTGETTNPVHLTVDTTLQHEAMAVRAFVSRTLSIQARDARAPAARAPAGARAFASSTAARAAPAPAHQATGRARLCPARAAGLQGRELAREFQEVGCEVRTAEAERLGLELLTAELSEALPGDQEGLADSFGRLQQSLEAARAYVDAVVAGKRKGSVAVGRHLAETVASVPHYAPEDFERMLADNQNDVTLVTFLSHLIRAHIALADKLGTMQLPLL